MKEAIADVISGAVTYAVADGSASGCTLTEAQALFHRFQAAQRDDHVGFAQAGEAGQVQRHQPVRAGRGGGLCAPQTPIDFRLFVADNPEHCLLFRRLFYFLFCHLHPHRGHHVSHP